MRAAQVIHVLTDHVGVLGDSSPYLLKVERMAHAATGYGAQVVPIVPSGFQHQIPGVSDFVRVDNVHNATQVAVAAHAYANGSLFRILPLRDGNVVTAAEASSLLEVPGIGPDIAARARDKLWMKQAFEAAGLPIAPYTSVSSFSGLEAFAQAHGDNIILKPRESSCSLGIEKISNREELHVAWSHIEGEPERYVAEAFLDIDAEYHGNLLVKGGQVAFHGLARYSNPLLRDLHAADMTRHYGLTDTEKEIQGLGLKVLQALGVKDETAAAHVEYFTDRKGKVYVGEVGLRLPGGSIVDVFEYSTGIHMAGAWINLLLDPGVPFEQRIRVSQDVATHMFWLPEPARVEHLPTLKEIRTQAPHVQALEWWLKEGSEAPAGYGSTSDRIGHAIFPLEDEPFPTARRRVEDVVYGFLHLVPSMRGVDRHTSMK